MSAPSTVAQDQTFSMKAILGPLIAIIVGLFMVILDGTAMNVAINELVTSFDSELSTVQWTVTGYMLAQAAVIPLAGWMSDRYGAKSIFLISVGLFTIGSLLCGIAGSIEQLILFRILQGLGGGMVMPIAMAYIYRLSPPDKVGVVMGMMGVPILLAPALGPVLAGYLVDFATWHWIFMINIPIGIIAIFIGLRTLPKVEKNEVAGLDIMGMIFGPLAFAALSYGVTSAGEPDKGWTATETLLGIGIGAVSLVIFIVAELRRREPLLELRVFRSIEFTKGILAQWVITIALFGTLFLFPIFLITAKGYSAFDTGLILLPQALTAGVFMPIGGKLFDKLGARPVVIAGLALVSISAFILSGIDAKDNFWDLLPPLMCLGAGMGLSMMPLNTHIIQAAPRELVSRVTALTNAMQQVVSALGIAVLTTILSNQRESYITTPEPTDQQLLQASVNGFGDTFFVVACIAVAGGILGLTLKRLKSDGSDKDKIEAPVMMH